jgi:transcriptional regulator with XRE-family HTH domain
MTNETSAQRLGRLIRERRKALKMTQAAIQEAGGPSTATLRLIESGKHTEFRPSTSDPLERLLRWQRGSIDAVLAGGNPSLEPRPLPPLSEVPPFRGADSLRWRLAIQDKPEHDRTPEERAWMAAGDAERDRLAELARLDEVATPGLDRFSDDELLAEVRKRMRSVADAASSPAAPPAPGLRVVDDEKDALDEDDEEPRLKAIARKTDPEAGKGKAEQGEAPDGGV